MDRIRWHVEQVIKCEGSNEYIEGLGTPEKAGRVRKVAVIEKERPDGNDAWVDCDA